VGEEGEREKEDWGRKKRHEASPRCGFRGTLRGRGQAASWGAGGRGWGREGEGEKEDWGGRRGMRLRLGADFGEPFAAEARQPRGARGVGGGEGGEREKEDWGRKKRHEASPRCGFRGTLRGRGQAASWGAGGRGWGGGEKGEGGSGEEEEA
jgi:hypothetical protein